MSLIKAEVALDSARRRFKASLLPFHCFSYHLDAFSNQPIFLRCMNDLSLLLALPKPDATINRVAVVAQNHVRRKSLHQLGIASTKHNVIADQRSLQPFDDVQNRLAPT